MDMHIVRAPKDRGQNVARQVAARAVRAVKGDGTGRVDGQQLGHVEDLHAVVVELAADDNIVAVAADLLPGRAAGERGVGRPVRCVSDDYADENMSRA